MRIRAQWTLDGASSIVSRPAIVALLTTGAVAVPTPLASVPFSFDGPSAKENFQPYSQPRKLQLPSPTFAGGQVHRVTRESSSDPEVAVKLAWSQPDPVDLAPPTPSLENYEQFSSVSRTEPPSARPDEQSTQLIHAIDEARFSEKGLQTTQLDSLQPALPSPEPKRTALSMPSMELQSMMRKVVSSRDAKTNLTAVQMPAPSYKQVAAIPIEVTPVVERPASSELANLPKSTPVQLAAAPASQTSDTEVSKYRSTTKGIEFDVPLSVNGSRAGNVSLLIADSDNISVQLSGLLALLQPIMDTAEFERMSASQNADAYVTLNDLRAAGLAVSFDKHDRLRIEAS